MGMTEEIVLEANDKQMQTYYVADNSQLQTDAPGIQYRTSKGGDKSSETLNWGSRVQARDIGDCWVQVAGKGFLPTLVGTTVILKKIGDPYIADNSQLKSDVPGINFRKSKNLEDKAEGLIKWGTAVWACDAGDGWIQLNDGKFFLPTTVNGTPVMVKTTEEKAPEPQVMQGSGGPTPAGVPPGSTFLHETYVGSNTTCFAVGGCLCCGCLACCILLCPIDERDVYVAPDGQKYTKDGAKIES